MRMAAAEGGVRAPAGSDSAEEKSGQESEETEDMVVVLEPEGARAAGEESRSRAQMGLA